MTTTRTTDGIDQQSADYRGALVYRQEYGYKLITMMVSLYTPDEQSHVVTHAYDLDILEEAEHLPAHPPLSAVDVYHFPATDGTEITLTIKSKEQERQAHYIIHATGVTEDAAFLRLDIIQSNESRNDPTFQSYPDLEIHFEA